jgi:hypothetical protein
MDRRSKNPNKSFDLSWKQSQSTGFSLTDQKLADAKIHGRVLFKSIFSLRTVSERSELSEKTENSHF